MGCEPADRGREAEPIAFGAESRDDADREVREVRMAPERLARVNVRKMHLDERNRDRRESIAKRDARVRQRAGIDHDECGTVAAGRVQAIDQRAFGVRLERDEIMARSLRDRGKIGVDLGQCRAAVNLRLAAAEQVEVRSVEDEDLGHRIRLPAGKGALVSPSGGFLSSSPTFGEN